MEKKPLAAALRVFDWYGKYFRNSYEDITGVLACVTAS
jgi:hypothetical protein